MSTELAPSHRNVGQLVDASLTSDERLIELWLHSGRRRSEHTREVYGRLIERFMESIDEPLQSITLAHLLAWRDSLTGALATKRLHVACVRSLLAFGASLGYLRFDVGRLLEKPAADREKGEEGESDVLARTVSESDVRALLASAATPHERALVHALYSSGLRVSELLAVRWRHITLAPRAGAYIWIPSGKGDNPRRVKVSEGALQALFALRPEHWQADSFVFATASGKPWDRARAHRTIKSLAKRAGVNESMSAHWLRHSHASHSIERGASPFAVRSQLGHSSESMTARYVHLQATSADALAL